MRHPEDERGAETIEATLAAFGRPPSPVRVAVVRQGRWQRLRRALAALGATWGLAVVAVFVPVAHIVLVPALLVAGVVLAVVRLREDVRVTGVRGVCPVCRAERDLRPGGRLRAGRTVHCTGCGHDLTLETPRTDR